MNVISFNAYTHLQLRNSTSLEPWLLFFKITANLFCNHIPMCTLQADATNWTYMVTMRLSLTPAPLTHLLLLPRWSMPATPGGEVAAAVEEEEAEWTERREMEAAATVEQGADKAMADSKQLLVGGEGATRWLCSSCPWPKETTVPRIYNISHNNKSCGGWKRIRWCTLWVGSRGL